MDSTRFMSCELKVDTASPGWHKTMRRMCDRIKEVSYSIDAQTGIVHVSGRINPRTLLKLLEDSGKHAALVRVDSGTRGPQDPEFPPPENGYYPEYTPYDPRAPPPSPPPPPPPLPPPPPPLPMPPRYTYSEPGFQQQPPHIDPYYGSESDGQCSIM